MDTREQFRKTYGGGVFDYEWVPRCPVCGGKGEFAMATRQRENDLKVILQVYVCTQCRSSYQNPRMTAEAMQEYYTSGKYRTYGPRVPDPVNKALGNDARAEFLASGILINPRRYLDVGCAEGYMIRAIKNKFGCEVVGYDIYPDPNAFIPLVLDRDKVEGKFDFISCIHVLEHLHDPYELLRWIISKMTDDGMLYLEVPLYHQLIIPHPIIYSRKSLPMLTKKVGLYGVVLDMKPVEIGIILAQKTQFDMDRIKFPYEKKTDEEVEKMVAGFKEYCITLYPERGKMPKGSEWLEMR